jgi:hypothetical protein
MLKLILKIQKFAHKISYARKYMQDEYQYNTIILIVYI